MFFAETHTQKSFPPMSPVHSRARGRSRRPTPPRRSRGAAADPDVPQQWRSPRAAAAAAAVDARRRGGDADAGHGQLLGGGGEAPIHRR
jgi:hypothetical protein